MNIPNKGCIPGLADDALVEIPAMVSARGIQGIQMSAFPPKLMNNVILPRMCRANNIMEAYRTGGVFEPDGNLVAAFCRHVLGEIRTGRKENTI